MRNLPYERSNMLIQYSGFVGKVFSRGVYEVFTYLLPGTLILYLASVIWSVTTAGWNTFVRAVVEPPLPRELTLEGLLVVLVAAYVAGHLSWPFKQVPRLLWYSATVDRIYASLLTYFDYDRNGTPYHEELIEELETFTDIDSIPRLDEFELISDESTHGFPNVLNPNNVVRVRTDERGRAMRQAFRVMKRFLRHRYPEFYHRGYERMMGLRRFWENVFTITAAFTTLSLAAIWFSATKVPALLIFGGSLLACLTALYRIRVLLLSPYRELFILFGLHLDGKLL